MQSKQCYEVTCLKCKGHSRLTIMNGDTVIYQDHVPIISSRLRGDMQWGFECQCGNNSLVAATEKKDLDFLVQHNDPKQKARIIDQIASHLKTQPANSFAMERA